ncbi:MAG: OmpA family protein [Bacteroidota bacterium]
MKKLLLLIFFLFSLFVTGYAQDEEEELEEKPKKESRKKDKKDTGATGGEEEGKENENDCPDPENPEAVKLFKKYQDKKKYEYKERIAFLKQCLEEEPDYPQANFEYARQLIIAAKNNSQSYKGAAPYLMKVINACPKYHSDPYYYLGIIHWEDKNYQECIKYMKMYLDFKEEDEKKYNKDYPAFLVDAKQLIKLSRFYDQVYNHPVSFDPQIVQGLSSGMSEYLPIISPDGTIALYTRQKKPTSKSPIESDKIIEVFTISKNKDGKWDEGYKMTEPFNRGTNEGGATLTIDNKHMYFTICRHEGGANINCDIWTSDFINGKWTDLRKLSDTVNTKDRWESQPSVSADGSTIYFASDRPGGYGGVDIWKTVKGPDGKWSAPINLGPKINTKGHEKSPFIHSDSQTLYFSSGPLEPELGGGGGHMGVGGYDIFYCRADTAGNWLDPVNIGYPINTKGDDLGFFVSTDGKTAYFASDDPAKTKNKTIGGYDIYSFDLYKDARPESVSFVEVDFKSPADTTVKDVKVQVVDAVTKKVYNGIVDTSTSKSRVAVINTGSDLLVKVEKEGVAFSSQLISAKDSVVPGKVVKTQLVSKPIEVGQTYTLNNIYYKSGSADLDPKSKIVLEQFADFLKKNPGVKVEIWGHTDDVGDDAANLALSQDRAYTVFEILLEMGVKKEQITGFKGWGEGKPLVENTSEANRAKNRRTEFVVTAK